MRNAALALAMIAPLAIGAAPRELAPPDPAPPRRIVSLNPCVDAILRETRRKVRQNGLWLSASIDSPGGPSIVLIMSAAAAISLTAAGLKARR